MLSAGSAEAYTFGGPLGDPCHEELAWEALRLVRRELAGAAPLELGADDRLAVRDLPFALPDDMGDLGGASLAIGVRDNDLKGLSGLDHRDLPGVHGDPEAQREHCLRRPEQDELGGSEAALADCRGFILERFAQALGGLDAKGRVDASLRMPLPTYLAFAGTVTLELPVFYVRMGQALHALGDSFTHTFRSPDHERVTVVLNWVDALDDFDEARDGPPHLHELDLCNDADTLRRERRSVASVASVELLRVALEPSGDEAAKKARAEAVLAQFLSFEPGCTHANRWCDAAENRYRTSDCGCAVVGEAPSRAGAVAFFAVLAAALGRRRAPQVARLSRGAAVVTAVTAATFSEASAAAESAPGKVEAAPPQVAPPSDPPKAEAAPSQVAPPLSRPRELWPEGSRTGWGVQASMSGAFDHGAMAYGLGGRYAITNRWIAGFDAEHNPWFSLEAGRIRPGAINAYATGIYRYPINERLALRSTLHLGASALLFDLVGAPKGSVGPYLGVNLLGLSYELGEHTYLLLDPADVAIAAPAIVGAPLIYTQYRLTIGVQFGG